MSLIRFFVLGSILLFNQQVFAQDSVSDAERFLAFFNSSNLQTRTEILTEIEAHWKPGYAIMTLETAYLLENTKLRRNLMSLLRQQTKQDFDDYDFNAWYYWFWNQPYQVVDSYDVFKAGLYRLLDYRFEKYFTGRQKQSTIRWDEIRWGGVNQDGIPPLRQPEMIGANEATYLDEDDVVFGIEVNGDVRAYPKRILAWHEMFVDEVGGLPLVGVYCTLCGSVILYNTEVDGTNHRMGTSGFLYRSNKLMYDQATQSLWSTLEGTPVVGPLVGKGIELTPLSVVTTTWGAWKKLHPKTQVLSLNTGHTRDYSEGAAYREYFATDELMFNTPTRDGRLKNKTEVLTLRDPKNAEEPLAISTKYLKKHPIYEDQIGNQTFVVFTDASGANRVYEHGDVKFVDYDRQNKATDASGRVWVLQEERLVSNDHPSLKRLPYHRAFWFGWVAAFPKTRLVK